MVIIMIKKKKQKSEKQKKPTRFIIMTITVNSKIIRTCKIMVEINVLQ